MTARTAALLLAGLAAAVGPGAASAEPPRRPAPAAGATPAPAADRRSPDQLRKEVVERMRALRAWRIVEELKLDETTSAKLFPILAKHDEQELALAAERHHIAQEIRGLLAAPHPDDAKLTAAINRMLANRAKRHASKDEQIKEVRKVLTPVQQAKLVLLLPRLEREFARVIRDVADGNRPDDAP